VTDEKKESNLLSLPEDMITLISSYLDKTDEPQNIKSARRKNFSLFRTDLIQKNRILAKLAHYAFEGKIDRVANLVNIRPDLRIKVLFTLAGLGAQNEMETILKQHPEDLLVSHRLRDISGAEFPSITLLQHALWTKDVRYMANMFLDCLPNNEQGEKIRIALEQQANVHRDKGVVYHLKDVQYSERHFNLQPLLTALSAYVKDPIWITEGGWTYRLEDKEDSHWLTKVGQPQTLVPAIIRHHYCDPEESFWDNPDFKKPKLERSLKFYNWFTNRSELWFESLFGLGSYFGICGGMGMRHCMARTMPDNNAWTGIDLAALTRLDDVRTTIDMPALRERLHTPIQKPEDDLEARRVTL
jgi:hypothetical protein